MEIKIRGHHIDSDVAVPLKFDHKRLLLEILQDNPEARVIVTNTYDDFCNRSCTLKCDEHQENLPNWDKAFIDLYRLPLNRPMSSRVFLRIVQESVGRRKHFFNGDIVMEDSLGKQMSYSEICEYLSDVYFNPSK